MVSPSMDPIRELMGQGAPDPRRVSSMPSPSMPSTPPAAPAVPAFSQQGPPAPSTSGTGTDLNAAVPSELPVISDPDAMIDLFYRQHGRRPSVREVNTIRAMPVMTRQLGRRPTKRELMGFLTGRDEQRTQPAQPFTTEMVEQ